MDPAALGTTIIGLDAIRSDEAPTDHPRLPRQHHRRSTRQLVAASLRRAADAVAPLPAPGALRDAR
jgi:hypothetical protein